MPPKYVSTAQLFIDPRDLRVLQNEVSPNAIGGDPTSITGYLESQARVIASDSIKSRVVASEGLDKDPEFGGEAVRTGLSALLADRLPSSGDAAARRHGSMRWRRSTGTSRCGAASAPSSSTSRSPRARRPRPRASPMRWPTPISTTRLRSGPMPPSAPPTALTGRLEELRNRLRIAEEKAERYKEANSIVGVGAGKSLSEEQLALNNAQLVSLRTRTTEAKAKYDQILATRASSIEAGAMPEAVASNTMTALRSQLGAALSREADLLASLGARHPGARRGAGADARRPPADRRRAQPHLARRQGRI